MRPTMARFAWLVLLAAFAGAAVLVAQQTPPPPLVTAQEIAGGLKPDGAHWLTFGGNYGNQRHSPLTQLTPANVNRLVPQWTFQTGTLGNFEATTLLRDNILYVTGPLNVAWALDARTGRQIWRYRRELPDTGLLTACCGLVNRGFGVLGDKLFMTTLDAHLVALDMKTGSVVWDVTLEDYKIGYAATIAPLVVKDKVRSSASPAASSASAGSSMPTRQTQASARGGPTRFPAPASRATTRGRATPGRSAARASGPPARTIPNRTWCSTAPGTLVPIITARAARETTCTAIHCSRSTPTRAGSAGTISSRRTTYTIGTRRRSRFSLTSPSADSRARW